MKIEKLSIVYPFNIGSFLNAKIGLEATLEEGDNVTECYKMLSIKAKELAAFEQGNGSGLTACICKDCLEELYKAKNKFTWKKQ